MGAALAHVLDGLRGVFGYEGGNQWLVAHFRFGAALEPAWRCAA